MKFAFEKGNKWEESKIPVVMYEAPLAAAQDGNDGDGEIMY